MCIDIEKILLELELLPKYDSQIMLQGAEPVNNNPFYGIGKVLELDHNEEEFIYPLFNIPYTNSIIQSLGMYRTRVMKMTPQTCYTYHLDLTKRMHIPLITNDSCMFIIDDVVSRYPADGRSYLIDTTKMHTAINASTEDRIHIVGCVKEDRH